MSGMGLTYDLSAIERLNTRIAALADVDRRKLLDRVGAIVESQTRERIRREKSGPGGTPWAAWSARHEKGRHGGHSLMQGDGDLLDSITHEVSSGQVEIGSNLIYARVHQEGSGEDPVKVPAHQRRIKQAFGRKLPFPVWVDVGPYAFVQNIPARPYLGLSAANEAELEAEIDDFFKEVLP